MIHHGDLFDVLPTLADASIDACVTDPPYGIGFMGKEWDSFRRARNANDVSRDSVMGRMSRTAPASGAENNSQEFQAWTTAWASEVYRVLKPGGHAIVFAACRNYHRVGCGIEDAGFEIRDSLAWLFGSGFPKSLNIGGGLGTALKPAHEPIVLARKPFKGSVKANVAQFGTGALNIDACRIPIDESERDVIDSRSGSGSATWGHIGNRAEGERFSSHDSGRWPANVCLDEIAAMVLDEQSGELVSGKIDFAKHVDTSSRQVYGGFPNGDTRTGEFGGDSGGASRFYYVAKPSREERDMGCYDLPARSGGEATNRKDGSAGLQNPRAGAGRNGGARNIHPTVKPVELMRWLVRLVTPPGGTVLDPFTGSGTTGMACVYEQRQFIGVEREAEYIQIAERRIAAVAPLFSDPPSLVARDAS